MLWTQAWCILLYRTNIGSKLIDCLVSKGLRLHFWEPQLYVQDAPALLPIVGGDNFQASVILHIISSYRLEVTNIGTSWKLDVLHCAV